MLRAPFDCVFYQGQRLTRRLDNASRFVAAVMAANREKSRFRLRHRWWPIEEIGKRSGVAGPEIEQAVQDAVRIGWARRRRDGHVLITLEGREANPSWGPE